MDMRGLQNFIMDIRKATNNREEEAKRVGLELAKIRSKFKNSASLSAYDRKKYVCKLLFIFMLGYEVDFGHMEAVQLLSGTTQSEKLIGYLAITVFLHENHELLTLTTHTVHKDLLSGKEFNMALALTAIANVGGRDFAETMTPTVEKILATPQISVSIRKKALLTSLRLFRKYREVVSVDKVLPIAVEGLNSNDMGLLNCSMSLITGLLNNDGDVSTSAMLALQQVPELCINIMNTIILRKQTNVEYMYYGVPAPWIQLKVLRLLQYFPPPENSIVLQNIMTILSKILKATAKVLKEARESTMQKGTANRLNAMNAVLVELVSLVVHWDNDAHLLAESTDLMSTFLNDKRNSNLRYLGLQMMTRLSFCSAFDFQTHASQHQNQVLLALHDVDISIRRRALDLLYVMCTKQTADQIVGELLILLPVAEFVFREDLILMIAILAEKFCTEFAWYVEVMLQVLTHGAENVPEDIARRVVHIVVNTPTVQKQAVETVFHTMNQNPNVPEVLIRVGGFLLGEFGYQIALTAECSPVLQFQLLHSKFSFVSNSTKAVLLTTYVKFFNLYDNPTLRDKVRKALQQMRSHIDPEIQQRATEYSNLINIASDAVLQASLEAMPPFEISSTALVDRLKERQKGTDRNIWSEKGEARDRQQVQESEEVRQAATTGSPQTSSPATAKKAVYQDPVKGTPTATTTTTPATSNVQGKPQPESPGAPDDLLGDVEPLDKQPGFTVANKPKVNPDATLDDIFAVTKPTTVSQDIETPMQQTEVIYFPALCQSNTGILYTDDTIDIKVTHEYRNADARLSMVVTNKTKNVLEHFSHRVSVAINLLLVQSQPHDNKIEAGDELTILFAARSQGVFEGVPKVQLSFTNAATKVPVTLSLPLPFLTTKFIAPYKLEDVDKIFALWSNTPTGKQEFSTMTALECKKDVEVTIVEGFFFQKLKLFTVRASGESVLGVGAHSIQPQSTPEFTPVIVHVDITSDRSIKYAVRNPNSLLQEEIVDQIKNFFAPK